MVNRVLRYVAPWLLALALSPTLAGAAEASSQMDVQIWLGAEPGRVVIVVGRILDPSTELPTTVRLPLPPGAQVVWAGEITGTGTGAEDPAREYEVVPGTGGDSVELTVTEYRNVQIETIAGPVEQDGDLVTADVEWVQSEPASVTAFSVRLPPGATDVQIDPPSGGPPDTNEVGETLYALPLQRYEPGQSSEVAVTYRAGAGAGAAPSGTQGSPLLPWLIGAFAVAVAALVFLLFNQRTTGQVDVDAAPEPASGDEKGRGAAGPGEEEEAEAERETEDDGVSREQDDDAAFFFEE